MNFLERTLRAKSPITPATPLAINKSFDFDIQNDNALKPWIERRKSPFSNNQLPSPFRHTPRRLSPAVVLQTPTARTTRYLEVPNVQGAQRPVVDGPANLAARRHCRQLRLQLLQQRYRQPQPVTIIPKPLSPRVAQLLARVGMIKYGSLFQREEIDFDVFCTLSQKDLEQLGIEEAEDRREIRKAVILAYDLT